MQRMSSWHVTLAIAGFEARSIAAGIVVCMICWLSVTICFQEGRRERVWKVFEVVWQPTCRVAEEARAGDIAEAVIPCAIVEAARGLGRRRLVLCSVRMNNCTHARRGVDLMRPP